MKGSLNSWDFNFFLRLLAAEEDGEGVFLEALPLFDLVGEFCCEGITSLDGFLDGYFEKESVSETEF